jgi:hypothetical protein
MNLTWLHVGVVYAGAIALARRWGGAQIPARIALLFYLLVLAFLFQPMTQDFVNVHADVLKTFPPWDWVMEDRTVANGVMNDVPMQEVPWAHQVRESWKSLQAPLWNPLAGSGMPLLANGQSQAFSPLRLLALPLDLGHSMTAEAAMKILVAMTFTFLYCRRRYSELASAIAAVTFGFSGFVGVWMHFPLATTGVLFPAVLYQIDLLVERRTFGRIVFSALVWVAVFFGGHPETAAHIFLFALLYIGWIVFVERPFARPEALRALAALAGSMTIAALLAAPLLLPLTESILLSRRLTTLQSTPFRAGELPATDAAAAILLIQPWFLGNPIEQQPDAVAGYAGVLAWAAAVAVLAQVVLARAWRSRETFFVLTTVLIAGAIFNWPLIGEGLHAALPIVAHARLRGLLIVLVAVQTATALDFYRTRRVPLLIGIAALFVAHAWMVARPVPFNQHHPAAMFPGLAVLAIALLAWRRPVQIALVAGVVSTSWIAIREWNPPTPASLMYPRTPILEVMESRLSSEREPVRVVGWGAMLFANTHVPFGFEDIRVHDPMANSRYVDFLSRTSMYRAADYFALWMDLKTGVLDYLNVRYVLHDDRKANLDPARFRMIYDAVDGRIFENRRVLPRFYPVRNVVLQFNDEQFGASLWEMDEKWSHTALLEDLKLESRQMHDDFFNPRPEGSPLATSRIVKSTPTDYEIAVDAPRWSLVVSSVPWWPGWKVLRDGKRIEPIRVNGAFIGFAVPPGRHDVRVWYEPWTFRLGMFLAAATALGLLAYRLRRRTI